MPLTNYPNGITSFGVPVLGSGPIFTTGNVFFVDSGGALASDNSSSGTVDVPFLTGDFAVGQCTANNGDYIVLMPGHNENFSAADSFDVDVAGVHVLGIGTGTDVPTFDYDDTAGEIVIGAANVTIENVRMRASTNAVVNAINIEAAGDRFTIRNCRFADPETSTDEFADAIIVEAGADEGVIENCVFSADAQAAVAAIELNGAVIGITIRNNTFIGDFSTACIRGDTTLSQKVLIEGNTLWNGDPLAGGLNAQPVIELLTGTIGVIRNNDIACNLASPDLSIVADACFLVNNRYQEAVGVGIGGVTDANAPGWQVATRAISAAGTSHTTANSPVTEFTVTGTVLVLGVALEIDTGWTSTLNSGNLECGTTNVAGLFCASDVVDGTAFAANDVWSGAADADASTLLNSGAPAIVSGAATNIVTVVTVNNMTAGSGTMYCLWKPLSAGASVVGA